MYEMVQEYRKAIYQKDYRCFLRWLCHHFSDFKQPFINTISA